MEMVDIYTRDGKFTGRTVEKHTPLQPGDYLRHAIVIMKTAEGYIMQQRSLRARHFPGRWDVTGGGVTSGEAPDAAAAREAMEELGVSIRPEDMRLMHTEIMPWGEDTGGILYLYAARTSVPEGGFRIAEREVNAVKLVPYGEFCKEISYNKTPGFMAAVARTEREF